MIRCVIVEDEKNSAERLQLLLERDHRDKVEVCHWLSSPASVLDCLQKEPVDLVFFDVEIQDRTAFELLEELRSWDFRIIFTTAHEEYALRAIKVSAIDYLLKPIDADELAMALEKITRSETPDPSNIQALLEQIKKQEKLPRKIALPSLFGIEYIPIKSIVRCQADVNYTHFHLKDGRKITVSKTLKEYETHLRPYGFFRVHNSHLINLQEVKFYNKGKGGIVTLNDGSEIEVASRRKEELMQLLKDT